MFHSFINSSVFILSFPLGNKDQAVVGRAKYFYSIVLSSVVVTFIYTINMNTWKWTDSTEANSMRIRLLPYAVQSNSINVSCNLQNSTVGTNETRVNLTSCARTVGTNETRVNLTSCARTVGTNETLVNLTSCAQELKVPVKVEETKKQKSTNKAARCLKKIQLWTYNAHERSFPTGVNTFKCPGSVCDVKLYSDKRYGTMKTCDALILYHRSTWNWNEMFAARPPGQKWIFYSLESPRVTSTRVIPPVEHHNNTYDYIMSFRYESDFRAGYGEYFPGKPDIKVNDTRNWAANKPKMVTWVASNCKGSSWHRTEFVQNLSKYEVLFLFKFLVQISYFVEPFFILFP